MLQLTLSTTCRRASCHSLVYSTTSSSTSSHRGTLRDRLASLLPPPRSAYAAHRASLWTSQPRKTSPRAPAFFHTSRPDFLPSSSSSSRTASSSSTHYTAPPHQGRVPYTPYALDYEYPLPHIDDLPSSLQPLHAAVGQPHIASDLTWQVFLSLSEAARSSFTASRSRHSDVLSLYRHLWWSIASSEPSVPLELAHLRSTDAASEIRANLRHAASSVRSFRELRRRLDVLSRYAPQGALGELERARWLYVHTTPQHLLRLMRAHMPYASNAPDVKPGVVLAQVRALGSAIPALLLKRAAVALTAGGRAKQALDLLAKLPGEQLDSRTTTAVLSSLGQGAEIGLTSKLLRLVCRAGEHALPERDALVGQLRRWPSDVLVLLVERACPAPLNAVQRHEQATNESTGASVFVESLASLDWCAPHAALALLLNEETTSAEKERAVRFAEARRRGEVQVSEMPVVQEQERTMGELDEGVLPRELELEEEEGTLLLSSDEEVRQRWSAWSALYLVTSSWILQATPSPFLHSLVDTTTPALEAASTTLKGLQKLQKQRWHVRTKPIQITLAATRLRLAGAASDVQRFASEYGADVELLRRWQGYVLKANRPSSRSVARNVDEACFEALASYLQTLKQESQDLLVDVPAQLLALELAIRLGEIQLAFPFWRALHERRRTVPSESAPLTQLDDDVYAHLILMALGEEPSGRADRIAKPALAHTLYAARVAAKPDWQLDARRAISLIKGLLASPRHALEAVKIMQHMAEKGAFVTHSDSVALVGTLAKAGEVWADHTLGLAEDLARAWEVDLVEAQADARKRGTTTKASQEETEVSLPPLEMFAYALDAASRAFIGWTPARRARIFALFRAFRKVLKAYLARMGAAQARAKLYASTSASAASPSSHAVHERLERSYRNWYADEHGVLAARKAAAGKVQRQTVLMAYNAALRAYLAEAALEQGLSAVQLAEVEPFDSLLDGTGLTPALCETCKSKDTFDMLLHELQAQLGVLGNAQTWGLQIVRPLLPFQVRVLGEVPPALSSGAETDTKVEVELLEASPLASVSEADAEAADVASSTRNERSRSSDASAESSEPTPSWKQLGFTRTEIFSSSPRAIALDAALHLFTRASKASYIRGGDVVLPLSGAAMRQATLLKPVRLKSADVGKFVVALARGGRLGVALDVVRKWEEKHVPSAGPLQGQRAWEAGTTGKIVPGGWDHAVVGSRLAILAMRGDRKALVSEMERLDRHAGKQRTNALLGRKATRPYRLGVYWKRQLIAWLELAEAAKEAREGKAEKQEAVQSPDELRRKLAWEALAAGRPISEGSGD